MYMICQMSLHLKTPSKKLTSDNKRSNQITNHLSKDTLCLNQRNESSYYNKKQVSEVLCFIRSTSINLFFNQIFLTVENTLGRIR